MFDQLVHDEALYACEHQRELFLNTVVKFGKTFQMILPLQKQNEPVNFLALSWHMDLERSVRVFYEVTTISKGEILRTIVTIFKV